MDNICHTLVGAAMGEAGLKQTTRYGMPVLLIAANLPDVDILAVASEVPIVALRRGWTHGVLAQLLLPAFFAGCVLLVDRLRRAPPGRSAVRWVPLLVLSYAGVLSHVLLDWLNTYGIRLLMPFSPRWFYGDAVFIVDPWLWLAFGAGAYVSRRRRLARPARVALVVASMYVAAMLWSARAARALVLEAWERESGIPPAGLMVGPAPIDPLRKQIIVDAGDHYRRGTFAWWPRRIAFDPGIVPRQENRPEVPLAKLDPDVRAILVWARFPYYEITPAEAGAQVTVRDLRFGARVGSVSVRVPR